MSDDVRRYGLPNPSSNLRRIEAAAREIGRLIGAQLPAGWGFGLVFFEFNGKEMSWISNAQRKDMVKALRELADNLEMDTAGGPPAPFSQ